MKLLITFSLVVGLWGNVHAQTGTTCEVILKKYRQFLVQSANPENPAGQLAASMNATGQWADIDYDDTERAKWQPLNHLKRLRDMALVWQNPQSVLFRDPALWTAIENGLDHWLEKRYQNPNWWHNQIGVPQVMRDLIVLLKENLSEDQLKGALEVLAQHRVQDKSTGANLTWSADLGLHYGVLTNDQALVEKCRDLLLKEIRVTTAEGIQPDHSFHQHGARLQAFHYGGAFLRDNIRLAWECNGTSLAFPREKIKILSDFVLNGWQWMARGIHTAPGTIDRAVSRPGELRSADIRPLIPYLAEIDPERKDEFLTLASRQEGAGTPLQGFRHYPYSDFMVYHQNEFSFFLKTISTRTLPTESINSENLKGKLLNSGDGYMIRDGNEYDDLMPVWDWEKLPQVTAFRGADQIVRQDFCGSVSDGESGFTAMDYRMKGKGSELLKAKKFWACHDRTVVSLIAGMETTGIEDEIYTTLDQCRLQGDVTVNKPGIRMKEGNHQLARTKWIHHAGIAYIPLDPSLISLHLGNDAGSWSSVNASLSPDTRTERIFCPVMPHPKGIRNSGYVITPAKTPAEASAIARNPSWEIIRNDSVCQAVRFKDETWMIAFYSPGSVQAGKDNLTVDKPCLILRSENHLYASNPSGREEIIKLSYGKDIRMITLPANGLSAKCMINE